MSKKKNDPQLFIHLVEEKNIGIEAMKCICKTKIYIYIHKFFSDEQTTIYKLWDFFHFSFPFILLSSQVLYYYTILYYTIIVNVFKAYSHITLNAYSNFSPSPIWLTVPTARLAGRVEPLYRRQSNNTVILLLYRKTQPGNCWRDLALDTKMRDGCPN